MKNALKHICKLVGARVAFVEDESFHHYDPNTMKVELATAKKKAKNLSHFGPEGNLFDKQFELFRSYGKSGTGERRYYIHNEEARQCFIRGVWPRPSARYRNPTASQCGSTAWMVRFARTGSRVTNKQGPLPTS